MTNGLWTLSLINTTQLLPAWISKLHAVQGSIAFCHQKRMRRSNCRTTAWLLSVNNHHGLVLYFCCLDAFVDCEALNSQKEIWFHIIYAQLGFLFIPASDTFIFQILKLFEDLSANVHPSLQIAQAFYRTGCFWRTNSQPFNIFQGSHLIP